MSNSTFTDSPFYHRLQTSLCALLCCFQIPIAAACVLLRGLVQHVLSPRCARRNILELDCLQALGIKRYTLGGTIPEVICTHERISRPSCDTRQPIRSSLQCPSVRLFRTHFDASSNPRSGELQSGVVHLVPRIINRATSGSPDIHEQIFDAILHSRLVVADMTVQSNYADASGKARWQANANVAYEVGLAAAWRNPEDVLLIHPGHPDHSYSFDVQNLRHVQYRSK